MGKTKAENDSLLKYSPFTYRNAWYFKDYNNLVKANETSPWGNENGDNISARRVLGLKHYELTNHLGNVMTVVTDKLTEEKEDPQQSVPTPAIKRAAVAAAYDYYPFGMLMPERFEQDETDQCTPVTRSMMVKKWVPIWELPISNSGTEVLDVGMGTSASYNAASEEIEVTADAMSTPEAACTLPDGDPAVGKKYSISILAGKNGGGPPATIEVIQDDGNGDQVLAQTTIELSESVTMEVTSVGTADPRIRMASGDVGATIRVKFVTYKEIDYMLEDVVTLECNNDDFDKDYRFGFNGMVKDNNLKGIGNSLDFGARIQDSRLGKWLSVDPKIKAHLSPYQFGANNPIIYIDPDGNTEYYYNGKWIGSDGVNNSLIGRVKSGRVERSIKKGSYSFPLPESLTNGYENDDMFVIDANVLEGAYDVLNKSISEDGKNREYYLGLNKDNNGPLERNKEGILEGPVIEHISKGGEGHPRDARDEVSIHSHPTGTEVIGDIIYSGNALKPSTTDKENMSKANMYIIVGKNGDAERFVEKAVDGSTSERIPERENAINIYDKGSKTATETISGKEANRILTDYKSRKSNK